MTVLLVLEVVAHMPSICFWWGRGCRSSSTCPLVSPFLSACPIITEAERRAEAWEEENDYIRHMPETSDEPLPLWFRAIEAGCND